MNSFESLWATREIFLSGIGVSLLLVGLCLAISLPLSALTYVALQESPGFARFVRILMDAMRCIPFLLLAYVVYYGLPELGLRMDAFGAGLLSLIIYHSAYFVEILRSAALSIPSETLTAADAFGFTRYQRYRRIVFPQLFAVASPVLANQSVMVIKDSALLMVITVQEITFAANFVSTNYFSPFAPFLFAMLLYWLMSLLTDHIVGRLGYHHTR
ncbi:polar amino acid ABC transporter permease [Raoultella planticola]|uniref:Polar amino acid ABC transporter permease n=1 Tax=Raoultella planticola TaxID=575 RepID=A0A443VFA1_RAOPL|nr:ABC transporter permease subunit [Raoultella planticola]RWT16102.1 polar amino acid ABC transporter permease [Raoultella planticola]